MRCKITDKPPTGAQWSTVLKLYAHPEPPDDREISCTPVGIVNGKPSFYAPLILPNLTKCCTNDAAILAVKQMRTALRIDWVNKVALYVSDTKNRSFPP